jgi:hypothetical protein
MKEIIILLEILYVRKSEYENLSTHRDHQGWAISSFQHLLVAWSSTHPELPLVLLLRQEAGGEEKVHSVQTALDLSRYVHEEAQDAYHPRADAKGPHDALFELRVGDLPFVLDEGSVGEDGQPGAAYELDAHTQLRARLCDALAVVTAVAAVILTAAIF